MNCQIIREQSRIGELGFCWNPSRRGRSMIKDTLHYAMAIVAAALSTVVVCALVVLVVRVSRESPYYLQYLRL